MREEVTEICLQTRQGFDAVPTLGPLCQKPGAVLLLDESPQSFELRPRNLVMRLLSRGMDIHTSPDAGCLRLSQVTRLSDCEGILCPQAESAPLPFRCPVSQVIGHSAWGLHANQESRQGRIKNLATAATWQRGMTRTPVIRIDIAVTTR